MESKKNINKIKQKHNQKNNNDKINSKPKDENEQKKNENKNPDKHTEDKAIDTNSLKEINKLNPNDKERISNEEKNKEKESNDEGKIFSNDTNTPFIPDKINKNENEKYESIMNKTVEKFENSNIKSNNIDINLDKKNSDVNNTDNIVNETKNNYEKFNLQNEYYLICPDCKKNILKLSKLTFNSEKKDFLVDYKCMCNKNNYKYIYQIISEKENLCEKHNNKLILFCEICNILFCEECKKEHKEHKIKYLTYKEIFSEEIMMKIQEKKEEFKEINFIQNIFQFYKKYYSDTINNMNLSNENNNNGEKILEKAEQKSNEKETDIIKEPRKDINEKDENLFSINYKNIKTLKGHENKVTALIKLSSDLIASGGYDYKIKIWDINSDDKDALIMDKNSIGKILCLLEFEPGMLLGGLDIKIILLWDLNDFKGKEYNDCFLNHENSVTSIVKCDENYFASASLDKNIIIWDYKNKVHKNILQRHSSGITTMIMLKNGHLCSGDLDNNLMIWDWKQNKCLKYFQPNTECVKSILELENNLFILGSEDNSISIWDKNFKNVGYLYGHKHSVRTLCRINVNYFASGSFDNTIKIWDLTKYECVQTLFGHQSNVICVIKYNDKKLISCSCDSSIKVWENS